jgi:hypothetical protein
MEGIPSFNFCSAIRRNPLEGGKINGGERGKENF